MGLQANVEILDSKVVVEYQTVEEAVQNIESRTSSFNDDERQKLRDYLKPFFTKSQPFLHEGRSRWALIWWRT